MSASTDLDQTRRAGQRLPLTNQVTMDLDPFFTLATHLFAKLRGTESKGLRPQTWLIGCEPRMTWIVTGDMYQEPRPGQPFPDDHGLAEWPRHHVQFQPEQEATRSRDLIHREHVPWRGDMVTVLTVHVSGLRFKNSK